MSDLYKKLESFFSQKNGEQPEKIKVCWDILAKILGYMLLLTDEELMELERLNNYNPKVLQEISGIRRSALPVFPS